MFFVKKFIIILLSVGFIILIFNSMQSISAEQNIPTEGLFVSPAVVNLVTTHDTDWKVYLQTIIRNADGDLINVTESAKHGSYIPHMISDHVFDNLMSEKEIITVDGIKYEKAQWKNNPSVEERFIGLYPIYSEIKMKFVSGPEEETKKMHGSKKDFSIWKIHYCADWENFGYSCIPVFQVLVPNMTIEPTDIVEHKWTVLREMT